MIKLIDVVVKLVGSFLVGLALAWWLGVSPSEGSNLMQIIMFAIGLALITIKIEKK